MNEYVKTFFGVIVDFGRYVMKHFDIYEHFRFLRVIGNNRENSRMRQTRENQRYTTLMMDY